MATEIQKQVLQLYVGILGRGVEGNQDVDQEGFEYWVSEIEAGNLSIADARRNFIEEQPEGQALYAGDTESVINSLYDNLFGREAEAEGLAYWKEAVDSGRLDFAQVAEALVAGAQGSDVDTLNARVDAQATIVGSGEGEEPSVPGETIMLTEGRDTETGTENDDTFTANVQQNGIGLQVNTVSTGDVVNGEGGNDTLKAQLVNESNWAGDSLAVMPTLNSVENVEIQALNMNRSGDLDQVTVDAVNMDGTNHYASVNSRGDLDILSVRIDDTQITNDITVEMRDTASNSDTEANGSSLDVRFEESSLRAAPVEVEADSKFFVQLADSLQDDATAPLSNVRITDLQVTHDGNEINLSNIESDDDTYEGLVRAVQAALDEAGFGDRYKASLGDEFTEVAGVATQVPGFNVVVEDTNEPAVAFEEEDVLIGVGNKLGVGSSASVQGDSGVEFESDTNEFKVTSDVILDGVGRGSDGGDLTIGSMSNSGTAPNTGGSTGVQVFDIEVRDSSNVGNFYSTNGALEELHIENGTNFEGDLIFRNDDPTNAETINGGERILVEDFAGDIVLGRDNDIVDLGELDAQVEGDVTYNADLNAGSYEATTGAGDDTFDIDLDNAEVTVSTGSGTNEVTLIENGADSTASVTGGAGIDTINGGNADITVESAAGSDLIFAENTGTAAVHNLDTDLANDEELLLHGRTVTVTLAGFDPTILPAATAAEAGVSGFESAEINIESSAANGYLTSRSDLNDAIIKAINEDDVLSKLATASTAADGTVSIEYAFDGVVSAAGINVDIGGNDVWGDIGSTSIQNAIQAAYEVALGDSTADASADYDAIDALDKIDSTVTSAGVESTGASDNVINAGAGSNDVIVLSSDSTGGAEADVSNDTVVFSGVNQGEVTIVNFVNGADTAGGDLLDFTAYLTNQDSTSGSEASAVATSVTVASVSAFAENSVVITDFDTLDDDGTNDSLGTATFANMTNAQVAAAMNENFAEAAAGGDLLGDDRKAVMMVENNSNAGEYKMYEVTFDADETNAEDFSVRLIGVADFGETLGAVTAADTLVGA